MQKLKIYIRIIILMVFFISIGKINFGIKTGYFNSDIEIFKTSLDVYSKYVAGVFVLISFLCLILKNRNKVEPKDLNIISPEFLKYTPLILFVALIIYTNFDKTATACSLIINKQKQINSATREFKIDSYDKKNQQLRLAIEKELESGVFTEELEFCKMTKEIYGNLENKENIKLEFKVGLLGIPFEPEYKKQLLP